MFSGLIEGTGEVAEVKSKTVGLRFQVASELSGDLTRGDSVAVNGVCLTVVLNNSAEFDVELSPETLQLTTLGGLRSGTLVNLERALRADDRFGGHFVLGHVDGIGYLDEVRQEGEFYWATFRYPSSLTSYIVSKGSIAVDGISLTVAGVSPGRFDVQIVPYTWEKTNLQAIKLDDPVNLECDIIGKYVVKALSSSGGRNGGGHS